MVGSKSGDDGESASDGDEKKEVKARFLKGKKHNQGSIKKNGGRLILAQTS